MIVSDHGGGPTSDRVVYLNRYLAQLGLLKYRPQNKSPFKRLKQALQRSVYSLLQGTLGPAQKKFLAGLLPGMREKFEGAYTSFADIDWSGTKAYCSEVLASPPSIWINRKGLKPSGIVTDEEYEGLVKLISEKLTELKDPRTGTSVIPRIYRRDEVFQGPFASEAPDLILDWWGTDGFSIKPSFPEDSAKPPVEIREHAPMKEPEWGGTHRLHGLLIMQGEAMKKGAQIEGARLMDIAPTVLYLLGQKVPQDMDGQVLLDMFDPEFVRQHPVQFEGPAASDSGPGTATPYSAEEAEQVEERLKALGYIE
jgi:predicted AlkP superfamily phosphohydrolase/phosphomutase